jgi:hypothetical protein
MRTETRSEIAGTPDITAGGRDALPAARDTGPRPGAPGQARDRARPLVLVAGGDTATCGPDGCAAPTGHVAGT